MKTPAHIERTLALSTAHMPGTKPDFGKLRVIDHEYGYFIPVCWGSHDVNEYPLTFEMVPEWMKPVAHYADLMKCSLVDFDMDAEQIPFLPTWEW